METFLLVLVSFIVGWKLCELFFLVSLKRLLNDLNVSEQQMKAVAAKYGIEVPSSVDDDSQLEITDLEVIVEQQPEGLFAYRKRDYQFLARGLDREELMANLVNNLTNVRVIVAKEDGADLIKSG